MLYTQNITAYNILLVNTLVSVPKSRFECGDIKGHLLFNIVYIFTLSTIVYYPRKNVKGIVENRSADK